MEIAVGFVLQYPETVYEHISLWLSASSNQLVNVVFVLASWHTPSPGPYVIHGARATIRSIIPLCLHIYHARVGSVLALLLPIFVEFGQLALSHIVSPRL